MLVEGPSRTDPSRLRGRIRHNKTVNFAPQVPPAEPGELVDVEIASATSTTLAGRQRRVEANGKDSASVQDPRPDASDLVSVPDPSPVA